MRTLLSWLQVFGLLAVAGISPALAQEGVLDQVHELNGRLQLLMSKTQDEQPSVQRELSLLREQIRSLRSQLDDDSSAARKLTQLDSLIQTGAAYKSRFEPAPAWSSMEIDGEAFTVLEQSGVHSVGGRCANPLELSLDRDVRAQLAGRDKAAGALWLRWQAPEAGSYAVKADGAALDTALAVFADCADAPGVALDEVDDSMGLDPMVSVQAEYAGQVFILRLNNQSASTGVVKVAAKAVRTISGRVLDAESNQPIPSIRVAIFPGQYDYAYSSGYTDSQGNYSASIWDDGLVSFRVRTQHQWYSYRSAQHIDQAWQGKICAPNSYNVLDCAGAEAFTLGSTESRTGVDFALSKGRAIFGTVTDSVTGLPAARIDVHLWDGTNQVREFRTGTDGKFRFSAVQWTALRLTGSSADYLGVVYPNIPCRAPYSCVQNGQGTLLNASAGDIEANLSLDPWSYLEVDLSVAGASHNGSVSSPEWEVYDNAGLPVSVTSSHYGAGRFRVGPLGIGDYRLRARVPGQTFARLYPDVDCGTSCSAEQLGQAGKIRVNHYGERVRVGMDLRKLPDLSGRVMDRANGKGLAGAQVMLLSPGRSVSSPNRTATTDETGRYLIKGVDSGDYFIFASARLYVDQIHPDIACESRTPLTSCDIGVSLQVGSASSDAIVDFELDRGRVVTGNLRSEGRLLPGGTWYRSDSVRLMDASFATVAATLVVDSNDGSYTLSDFKPGAYFVGAALDGYFLQLHAGANCPNTTWNFASCPLAGVVAVDTRQANATINFDLMRYGARLVRVTDATSGEPLAGIALDLWNASGAPLGGARTNAQGRALLMITGGEQQVRLSTDNAHGYIDEVYDDRKCAVATSVYKKTCSLDGATTIRLPDTSSNLVELRIALNPEGDAAIIFRSSFE